MPKINDPLLTNVGALQATDQLAVGRIALDEARVTTPADINTYVEATAHQQVKYDTTPTGVSTDVGTSYWDADFHTISTKTTATTTLQHGQEVVVWCKNRSGVNIADGQAVYIISGNGAVPTIAKADADSETMSYVIGLATQAINDNADGFVTVIGNVNGIQTDGANYGETWTEGDIIYLSSTLGGLTKTKPIAPKHGVRLAVVTYAHANNGTLFVHPDSGFELDELHDVLLTNVAAGNILVRNAGNTVWENKNFNTIGVHTLTHATTGTNVTLVSPAYASLAAALADVDPILGNFFYVTSADPDNQGTYQYSPINAGDLYAPEAPDWYRRSVQDLSSLSPYLAGSNSERTIIVPTTTTTQAATLLFGAKPFTAIKLPTAADLDPLTGARYAQGTVFRIIGSHNDEYHHTRVYAEEWNSAEGHADVKYGSALNCMAVVPDMIAEFRLQYSGSDLSVNEWAPSGGSVLIGSSMPGFHGDGWGNLAVLDPSGMFKHRYSLSATEYSKLSGYVTNPIPWTDVDKTGAVASDVGALSITAITDTKEITGWVDPSLIAVTYNKTNRTITLTGTLEYYWRGVKTTLASPWTSDAHSATLGNYYLSSTDGSTFTWATTIWGFDALMVAAIFTDASNAFALREVHSTMDYHAHEEFHRQIGTYRKSGGALSGITLSSTTAANRRPAVAATDVMDEDLPTTIPSKTAASYTQLTLTSTALSTFTTAQADIVPLSTNRPYYNSYSAPNWGQTLMSANQYMSVWLVAVPVTDDADSQIYRYLWLQGQSEGTLAQQQILTPASLNLGQLTNMFTEFVFIGRLIIKYGGANWTVEQVDVLNTNKQSSSNSIPGSANTASSIAFTPAGNIAATNVQAAMEELDSEKVDDTLARIGANTAGINITSDLGGATEISTENTLYVAQLEGRGTAMFDKFGGSLVDGAGLIVRKAAGNASAPSNVVDGDQIGYMDFRSYSGTEYFQQISIAGYVDGTFTSGQAPPSRLIIATNQANGGSTERVRITNKGYFLINTPSQAPWSADTYFTVKSTLNEWAANILGHPASGAGYGLRCNTLGNTASDYPLYVSSGASGTNVCLTVKGNGDVAVGGNLTAGGVAVVKNPMTTAGDIIYGGTSGAPTRLAKGTAAQVLTMNAGATAPEWAAAAGAGAVDYTTAVSITSAASTPLVGRLMVVSGTSADYTVGNMPSAASNSGKVMHFKVAAIASASKLYTINGDVYWADEIVVLWSDGSNWITIDKVLKPMAFSAYIGTTQDPITTATHTLLKFDTERFDRGGVFDESATNYKFTPRRTMEWDIRFGAFPALNSGTITREFITLYKNGTAFVRSQDTDFSTGTGLSVQGNTRRTLTAGDYFQIYQYTVSSSSPIISIGGDSFNEFSGTEVLP